MLAGVRDFPALMGAGAPASQDFAGEARFGARMAAADVRRRNRDALLPGGDRRGQPPDRRRSRHLAAAPGRRHLRRRRPALPLHPAPSRLPRRPRRARRSARTSPGATRPRSASASRSSTRATRRSPTAACRRASASSRWPTTKPRGHLLTAIPFGFYPEREWRDDLELGATELSLALSSGGTLPPGLAHTDPSFYLAEAARWAREYVKHSKRNSETLNLYDVSGLAHYELVRALRAAGSPSGLAIGEAGLLASLRARAGICAGSQAGKDPFGFGFPWAEADTASHGDGLAVMAAEYDGLTGESTFAAGRRALARQRPRRERLGRLDGDRRRHRVPALPLPSGRQPRRLARRLAAGARRRRRRGPERRIELGRSRRDAGRARRRAAIAYARLRRRRRRLQPTTSNRSRRPSPRSTSPPARCSRSPGRPAHPRRFRRAAGARPIESAAQGA